MPMKQKNNITERGGSVVTHETRIRDVPGSNPVGGQPGWGFSGFLNLKIAKELVIFKDKCRVGPHIPLQMYKFDVSQDLMPLLLTKWWTTSEVGLVLQRAVFNSWSSWFPTDDSRDKTSQSKKLQITSKKSTEYNNVKATGSYRSYSSPVKLQPRFLSLQW